MPAESRFAGLWRIHMIPDDQKTREKVLAYLKTKTSKPASFREIAGALRVPSRRMRSLKRLLRSMAGSGDIYKTRTRLYGLSEQMSLVNGTFEAHRDGYGFVLPEKMGERDLFIPPGRTSGAMTGDRVIARVESPEKREARIIRITERKQKRVVGKLCFGKNLYYVEPRGRRIPFDVSIAPKDRAGAKPGDTVVAEITSFPTVTRPPEGRVVKILPASESPRAEVDAVIENSGLPHKFPGPVLAEARVLSDKVSVRGRVDCRPLLTVTIDGEMAKDFDDAISIEHSSDGFTLWVHIADVSHYVPWNSALDVEARRRGTSVYFPGRVVPMLPKALSNNLCSLLPKTDRFTFTVQMEFDGKGNMIDSSFYPSMIHSNERMTYTSVKKILIDHDPVERERYAYLIPQFEIMAELCQFLRSRSSKRGSLDFDLPEPEVLLDIQGRPEAILRSERNLSHMIVESFMIAANEAVATFLEQSRMPSLYRVHEKPDTDKLDDMKRIFRALGLTLRNTGPKSFHRVFRDARGTPGETLVNMLLLRSLKQAKYATENIGHFGLASGAYTHFTSPIRRYPDLVVHRILRETLRGKKLPPGKTQFLLNNLPDIAFHSSRTERVADEAEREVVDAMRVWYMKDRIGEEFEGFVKDINSRGIKVQLREVFVEGFLRVSSLTDDYYRFDEKHYRLVGRHTRRAFTIGKTVNVRIDRVDIEERSISLGIADDQGGRKGKKKR